VPEGADQAVEPGAYWVPEDSWGPSDSAAKVCPGSCIYIYVYIRICIYMYMYMHMYIHTYIHTRSCTCTYPALRAPAKRTTGGRLPAEDSVPIDCPLLALLRKGAEADEACT